MFTRHFGLPAAFVWALAATWTVPRVLGGQAEQKERALRALESLRTNGDPPTGFFGPHGGPCEELLPILLARFAGTKAVCQELDALDWTARPAYGAALLTTLGIIKDPAAIPWLRAHWEGPMRERVFKYWLPPWLEGLPPGLRLHKHAKWFEGDAQWSQFFSSLVRDERDPRQRIVLVQGMASFLHDGATIRFFRDHARAPDLSPKETLLVNTYLRLHGEEVNAPGLRLLIADISASPRDEDKVLLLAYAPLVRDEAFVPWLISVGESPLEEGEAQSVEDALRQMTFCRSASGKRAWRDWYQENGSETYREWVDRSLSDWEALAKIDIGHALRVLQEQRYLWADAALYPRVQGWLQYKELHSEIAVWIGASYHPFWRDKLKPLARRIIDESRNELTEEASDTLRILEFLPDPENTWERYVRWGWIK
jgi:hypothetical protein